MGELIVPILMLLAGSAFYWESGGLRIMEEYPMTSASYPKILAALLILCSICLIIQFILKRKQYIEAERKRVFDPRLFAVFGLFIIFYFAIGFIGYIPSAVILMASLSFFLQKEKLRLCDTVVLPLCLSVGLYFIFGFMSIYLPTGSLFQGLF